MQKSQGHKANPINQADRSSIKDDKQVITSTARVAYVSTEQLLNLINQTRNWNPGSSASHWHPAYSDMEATFTCSLSTCSWVFYLWLHSGTSSEEGAKSIIIFWILFESLGVQVLQNCSCLAGINFLSIGVKTRCMMSMTWEKRSRTHTCFQVSRPLLHFPELKTSEQSWHKSFRRQLYSETAAIDELSITKDNNTNHLCKQNSNQINCWPHGSLSNNHTMVWIGRDSQNI